MGYNPSTYEKAPTEDENTNNDTQNNDGPSTISPKVVFAIIGLLIGVAIGYGIAQVPVSYTHLRAHETLR